MERAKRLVDIYKKAFKLGRGNYSEFAIEEYPAWHKKRGKEVKIPQPRNPNYPTGPGPEDILEQLKIENQRLKEGVKLVELTQQCQQLELENLELKDQKLQCQREALEWKHALENEHIRSDELMMKAREWENKFEEKRDQLIETNRKSMLRRRLLLRSTKELNNTRRLYQEAQNQKAAQIRAKRRLDRELADEIARNVETVEQLHQQVSVLQNDSNQENEELRQTVGELTEQLSELQMEHFELRANAEFVEKQSNEYAIQNQTNREYVDNLLKKLCDGVTEANKMRDIALELHSEMPPPRDDRARRLSRFLRDASEFCDEMFNYHIWARSAYKAPN